MSQWHRRLCEWPQHPYASTLSNRQLFLQTSFIIYLLISIGAASKAAETPHDLGPFCVALAALAFQLSLRPFLLDCRERVARPRWGCNFCRLTPDCSVLAACWATGYSWLGLPNLRNHHVAERIAEFWYVPPCVSYEDVKPIRCRCQASPSRSPANTGFRQGFTSEPAELRCHATVTGRSIGRTVQRCAQETKFTDKVWGMLLVASAAHDSQI